MLPIHTTIAAKAVGTHRDSGVTKLDDPGPRGVEAKNEKCGGVKTRDTRWTASPN
jgi:hypothetical protein